MPGRLVAPTKRTVPFIKFGAGRALGGLTKLAVRRVLRGNLPRLRACYRHVPRDTEPKTIATFEIERGRVTASAATGPPKLASCVAAAIRSLRFPDRPTITSVRYPLQFRTRIQRH